MNDIINDFIRYYRNQFKPFTMDIKGRNFIRFSERQEKFDEQNSEANAEKQHKKGKLPHGKG
jgi:polyhydroxyalkanoate synthesis regulator protein